MPSSYLVLATATAAKSGSQVTATINGIDTSVQVSRDVPVALGDVLMVQKVGSQWFCTGRFYTAAPAAVTPAPPPPPKPAVVTGKLVCAATYTGSYRDGKWRTDTSDVVQGSYGGSGNSTGAAFYRLPVDKLREVAKKYNAAYCVFPDILPIKPEFTWNGKSLYKLN